MNKGSKDFLCEKINSQEEKREVSMVGEYYEEISHFPLSDLKLFIEQDIRSTMSSDSIYCGDFRIEVDESGKEKRLTVVVEYLEEDVINRDFIKRNIEWGSDGILKRDFLEESCKKIFTKLAPEALLRISMVLNDYNKNLHQISAGKRILISEHFSSKVCFDRGYIQGLIRPIPLSMLEQIDETGRISSMVLSKKRRTHEKK